ncbi:MAG: hypothetical protein ABIL62_13015, partial [Planctomycetota bacterium]
DFFLFHQLFYFPPYKKLLGGKSLTIIGTEGNPSFSKRELNVFLRNSPKGVIHRALAAQR